MSLPAPPTRFRYVILGLLCLLAMITYMDRAANGSAKAAIMADLNADLLEGTKKYNTEDFFWVLMAFQFAYAIFEVPSGWLGDTRGPRSVLFRVVVWWSIFVALTGFVGLTLPGGFYLGFIALIVIQFLFGVGEAGAFPNISKALYNWFPADSRGFAKSIIWMSARLMGGLTPLVWVVLTEWKVGGMHESGGMTWRVAIWVFAGVAAVWAVAYLLIFTNSPRQHRRVNEAEATLIESGKSANTTAVRVPWGKLLASRNLWAVCGMYVVTNFCWYFLMYNHPKAMKDEFPAWDGTPNGRVLLALLTGAPLLVGMLGCYVGGVASDRYIRRTGDRKWGRRIMGMVGYGLAGLCYLAAIGAKVAAPDNVWALAVPLMLMGFCNDLIMAPAWAVCQDIGREYAATVSGAMNMVGNLVGAVSGILLTGLISTANSVPVFNDAGIQTGTKVTTQGYVTLFAMYAAVYFVGVGLWMLIDANKPVVEETKD